MIKKLEQLFQNYQLAFQQYNMKMVQGCYHLPCALHTPDKIAYLVNEDDFTKEFIDIFTVLKHANTTEIIATKASYTESIGNTLDVCIDWAFINDSGEVFADFTAFYHLIEFEQQLKIVSVVSHELNNSIELEHALKLT